MKAYLAALTLAASLVADEVTPSAPPAPVTPVAAPAQPAPSPGDDDQMSAQPKLLRITGRIDGSGRIVFTRDAVHYEHKNWKPPTNMTFGGEPWPDLSRTPAAWTDTVGHLDLTKAWIVKRQGRDVIALEQTPDGFDLYLCDSPNGAADYEVMIAIPRRP